MLDNISLYPLATHDQIQVYYTLVVTTTLLLHLPLFRPACQVVAAQALSAARVAAEDLAPSSTTSSRLCLQLAGALHTHAASAMLAAHDTATAATAAAASATADAGYARGEAAAVGPEGAQTLKVQYACIALDALLSAAAIPENVHSRPQGALTLFAPCALSSCLPCVRHMQLHGCAFTCFAR